RCPGARSPARAAGGASRARWAPRPRGCAPPRPAWVGPPRARGRGSPAGSGPRPDWGRRTADAARRARAPRPLLELAAEALEGAQVALFVAQDLDDHVLGGPVDAVAGLDDPHVVIDGAGLG